VVFSSSPLSQLGRWHAHCEPDGVEPRSGEKIVKQCSVLLINAERRETSHRAALEEAGFRVTEICDWPDDNVFTAFEVVLVVLPHMQRASMLAARIRAKPHFGHRVLIAVVPSSIGIAERRDAIRSGFDDVAGDSRSSRVLLARIMRRLRARPEHRCFLPDRKRPAA
jgi:hypothetical protein